jgi:putative ABC transport system ATP-binding protein
MLEMNQLAKKVGSLEQPNAPYLFSNISVHIGQAERIALIGASGQGKSTLLRTMALLYTPDDGEMRLAGNSFREVGPRQWRKQICYVAQQAVMLPGTVEDNLATVSRLHGNAYDRKLADRLLSTAGLQDLDPNKLARELSGGEMQRIALIRSLLLRPSVLLLDEVTSSLDMISTRSVELLLQQWHTEEGTAMIWVTHELEQAARCTDRLWFMSGGTLAEDAETTAFFNRPETEAARAFIGYQNESVKI